MTYRKALEDCLGCVTAAEAEGLHEVIADLRGTGDYVDRLIDLVERRLLWVRNYAEPALSARPRTFLWITRNGVPFPHIVFDDPRVGCEGMTLIKGTERKLHPDDGRPLSQLALDYPAKVDAA